MGGSCKSSIAVHARVYIARYLLRSARGVALDSLILNLVVLLRAEKGVLGESWGGLEIVSEGSWGVCDVFLAVARNVEQIIVFFKIFVCPGGSQGLLGSLSGLLGPSYGSLGAMLGPLGHPWSLLVAILRPSGASREPRAGILNLLTPIVAKKHQNSVLFNHF